MVPVTVDVVTSIEEGNQGKAKFFLEGPDVFYVGNAHAVTADLVAVVLIVAGRKVGERIAADGIHAG